MRKSVTGPKCGHVFDHELPDVSPVEAAQLKAISADRGVVIECPICKEANWLLLWDLPGLPDATSGH